ncbi:hypothetical protein [Sporosarcina sp. OR05]|uniref:hypothetical protein n=1 Tax=Sporosarcina sp. OR05 TaxID=2969819 RepID=UPI00352AD3EB
MLRNFLGERRIIDREGESDFSKQRLTRGDGGKVLGNGGNGSRIGGKVLGNGDNGLSIGGKLVQIGDNGESRTSHVVTATTTSLVVTIPTQAIE